MDVEFRIAKLERLLSAVSLRRARVPVASSKDEKKETARAGWDSLERGFRAALSSAERQRERAEISFRG
jgi:hypothetical protein